MGLAASISAAPERLGTAAALGACSRASLADDVRAVYISQLGAWPSSQQLPIVYSDIYNIGFLGVTAEFHVEGLSLVGSTATSPLVPIPAGGETAPLRQPEVWQGGP